MLKIKFSFTALLLTVLLGTSKLYLTCSFSLSPVTIFPAYKQRPAQKRPPTPMKNGGYTRLIPRRGLYLKLLSTEERLF